MDGETAALPNGTLFENRYEIQGELGSGSLSRVYLARQISTGQSVVIKLLSAREGSESSTDSEVERFRRETQICAALSHINIVSLVDSGETTEGQLYAIFERVPGDTLARTLEREGALGVRESVRLMTQALDALAAAHAQGIVHRDLKPANLMLSGTGARRNLLVLDFGLGGLAEGRRRVDWQTLTQPREFLGTPLYAAPEQLAGKAATPRSDLYSLGLIFLECLTGRHPFEAEGAVARLLTGGGAVEIPDWLRGHRLSDLIEKITAREADKRDVSAESLIEALDSIVGGAELPVAPEETPAPRPLTESGEHRHLTAMFCDLVDSAGLTQRLDAEAYRRVVQAYQAHSVEAIERYEGHVVQYLGDGLLIYFGYPQAHEDDAERAVRAGREILRELQMLNPRLEAEHGVELAARVGIHTGPVVVGEMGSGEKKEALALGDTPILASRLQGVADPGTVVISEATLRLVAGLFVTEDRGTPELKGISEPIRVYRVLQPSGVTSRLDRAPALTPFVGREQELGLLLDRFEQTQEQRGQALLIAGEAGIGKSRLVHRLRERLAEIPHTWLECRCSPYTQKSALYPLIELVEYALGFGDDQSTTEKLGRLERGLSQVGLEPAETLPLVASLLSLRLPERYAPLEISPQLQRQKTLATLLAWVLALSERQPLVLLVEDLHWIDPSTLEWLGLLIEQCPTAKFLLMMTHRPDFEPPWPGREHLHAITLSRLSRHQARELVTGVIAEAALTAEFVEQIARRSDGVPLFVEELAKGAVEAGSADDIPETLQDSLMARLDRLGEAKEMAQFAATIGREFEYRLLAAVAPLTDTTLREGLDRLVEAEIVYRRGLPPDAIYTFKHALIQETAYQSLLKHRRRELHARVAESLEALSSAGNASPPELLAQHYENAELVDDAVAHYLQAGEQATQRSANVEAMDHLARAITLLRTRPESAKRNRAELRLQMTLGIASMVKGWASTEVEHAYQRARELCEQLHDLNTLAQALAGLSECYRNRGELELAYEIGEQLLDLAERNRHRSLILEAHVALAVPLFYWSEWRKAYEHLGKAIALDDSSDRRPLVYGQDPGVAARSNASVLLWILGCPDQALQMSREAIRRARQDHPLTLANALGFDAYVRQMRRERKEVQARAEEIIAVSREHSLAQHLQHGRLLRAWSLAGSANGGQAIEEFREGLALLAGTGFGVGAPYFLGQLAEAMQALGRVDEAEDMVSAALAVAEERKQHFYDTELLRLKGDLLLLTNEHEAESLFRRSLEIARSCEGRSYELRAATSLARLWQYQGRRAEARGLLAPIYECFTEGFDTQDLKDAKVLLEKLG